MGEVGKRSTALPFWVTQLSELLKNGALAAAVLNSAIIHSASSSEKDALIFLQDVWEFFRRRRLPAGGARDARGLKPVILRRNFQPLREALSVIPHLGASASAQWAHQQRQLRESVRHFAKSKDLMVAPADIKDLHGLKGWPFNWEDGQLHAFAKELAVLPEFVALGEIAVDAARLMLFMLCTKWPVYVELPPPEPTERSVEAASPVDSTNMDQPSPAIAVKQLSVREHLDQVLTLLKGLSDEDQVWEELEQFLSACKELDARRRARRARRLILERALERLSEPRVQAGLSFLSDLKGQEQWRASAPAEADLDVVEMELHQFLDELQSLSTQLELPQPRNIQESRERNKKVDALVAEIERLHRALSEKLLSTVIAPPIPASARGSAELSTPAEDRVDDARTVDAVAVERFENGGVIPVAPEVALPKQRGHSQTEISVEAPSSASVSAAGPVVHSAPEPSRPTIQAPPSGAAPTSYDSASESPMGVVVVREHSEVSSLKAPARESDRVAVEVAVRPIASLEAQTVSNQAAPQLALESELELLGLKRLSRQEAAQALLAEPSSLPAQSSFLFALIAEGDVAGAYWLARAIEAKGERPQVPSWLLAALVGSMRLHGDSVNFNSGMLTISSEHGWPEASHLQWLVLAAALPTVIRAPGSGLMNWLVTPTDLTALRELVEPLRDFALYGLSLPADSPLMLRGSAERSERIHTAIAEVRRWHERIADLRTSYVPAKHVLNSMLKAGDLKDMLHAAERDARGDLEAVGWKLALWRDDSRVRSTVEEVRRREQIKDRIVGPALAWIQSRIEELCDHVAAWFELAQLDEKLSRDYDWVMRQLEDLRHKLSAAFPKALRLLDAYEKEHDFAQVAAGAAALRRALRLLADMLSCRLEGLHLQTPPDLLLQQRLLEFEGDLELVLERRLMTLPSVRLPSDKALWGEALEVLIESLSREVLSKSGVEGCIEEWLVRKDFRFLPQLLALVDNPERHKQLEERIRLEEDAARRELKRGIERIRSEVEQAVVDGFIGDERSGLIGRLDGIVVDTLREIDKPQQVLEEIGRELTGARHRGLESQRERWLQLQPRLKETSWTVEQRELAARRIEDVLTADDYRSADELLARLEDSVENHREFDSALFSAPRVDIRHLEDFLQVLPRLELALQAVRGRETPKRVHEVLSGGTDETEGHRDLRQAHDAWFSLVNARAHLERVPELLVAILGQLGFQLESGTAADFEQLKDAPHLLFQVRASSRRLSPVPHFGSRADGRLRVMCLWVQPGREVLTGVLQQLRSDSEGTLLLYLDRLGLMRRRQLGSLSRLHGSTALVVDEWLLLYLASQHEGDGRLHALFDCTLPFTAINPYVQRAGTVPPEMFFGREEMARRLASFDETSLVYGGRQLGKSALLEQVERLFTEADSSRHFTILLDIKDVGDPAADQMPEKLWPRLREELKRKRFLSPQVSTDNPDELVRRIGEILGGDKGRKLLILLDEADNFLDADAKRGFEQVKRLRELMSRHAGLCKVVLAGLHNVQRFQGIANQPLAHFGRALLVGPLEARDANELVRRPMEALGYRFPPEEKNGSILRILSYTNYHPGLIQLFCRELVDMLQRRADPQLQPPYPLREVDVEDVYRKQETRQLVRERFDWTLALDTRYQAIVWSLIVYQEEAREGYSRNFSTSAVLSLVRGFWPQGFEEVESDQMRGLLDEMVGLGVLVRNAQEEYRLRSPNVVRLLGSTGDIWVRLAELANKPAIVAFDADHHHVRLAGGGSPRFSPLTYAQERLLTEQRSNVAILFGCRATQIDDLPEALRRALENSERPQLGAFVRVPEQVQTPREMQEWLKESFRERKTVERILFLRELSVAEAEDGSWVDAAQSFCEQVRNKKRWARVVFLLRPVAAWAWMTRAVSAIPAREHVLTMPLKRWTRPALVRLFDEADIRTADEEFRKRVLEVTTGGWPFLLQRFVKECRRRSNERRVAEDMERELRVGSLQAAEFWDALDLREFPRIVEILRLIHEMGGVSPSTSFEGVLEGDVGELAGRSELLLQLLVRLGCLEARGDKLYVERRVAEALPA